MSNVFISIVNYNSQKDLLNCLESLNETKKVNMKLSVVIIDNSSKEEARIDDVRYKNFELTIIKNKINNGFSGGQNQGIKFALSKGADFVVVLNADVILDKDVLVELLKTFESSDLCGLVSPKIYFAKGHEFHKDRYKKEEQGKVIWYAGGEMDWNNVIGKHRGVDEVDKGQFDKLSGTDFVSGCCMIVKKEVFEKIGYFDERYFLYYEDNDFSQRAKINGFKLYYEPKAFLWHLNAGSTGGSGSILQDYFITRNRLLFGSKFSSFKTKVLLYKEGLKLSLSGRPWQKKGAIDFFNGRFGKGSFNL